MNKEEFRRHNVWKVSAECQNTSCKYKGELKTGTHHLINDFMECPKCGCHSFKAYKIIHDKSMIK